MTLDTVMELVTWNRRATGIKCCCVPNFVYLGQKCILEYSETLPIWLVVLLI